MAERKDKKTALAGHIYIQQMQSSFLVFRFHHCLQQVVFLCLCPCLISLRSFLQIHPYLRIHVIFTESVFSPSFFSFFNLWRSTTDSKQMIKTLPLPNSQTAQFKLASRHYYLTNSCSFMKEAFFISNVVSTSDSAMFIWLGM